MMASCERIPPEPAAPVYQLTLSEREALLLERLLSTVAPWSGPLGECAETLCRSLVDCLYGEPRPYRRILVVQRADGTEHATSDLRYIPDWPEGW